MLAFSGMARLPVSITIISLNEETNIARALKSVAWAEDILVVDSGSTDRTVEIARTHGARVLQNAWLGYGQQKNFAQAQAKHDWVLNIDADEVVSPALFEEIERSLAKVQSGRLQADAFCFPRKTYYLGKWIRHGGWYPNVLVRLANRNKCSWTEPHVHEELLARGPVVSLQQALDHYAFTSIRDQILTNLRFARLGTEDLRRKGVRPSLIRLIFKPAGKFLETYFLKRGFLDGLPGFIISINAAHSIFLKYAFLFEPEIEEAAKRSAK
ncbi:MAG TPA: glycosyltransferase family 2 protein [Bdellovibrionales bacterium]|nr:glycosyltransferase family 2 protein [Bdellovibrionales bacterium]